MLMILFTIDNIKFKVIVVKKDLDLNFDLRFRRLSYLTNSDKNTARIQWILYYII